MRRDAVAPPAVTLWRRVKDVVYRDVCLIEAERQLDLDREDLLLDIGGGGAYYLSRLAPRVRQAVLVDRFAGMYAASLDVAQRTRGTHAMAVVCGDAHALPLATGSATKLLCNQVLEHLDHPAAFIAEAGRVLKPGGVLVVISQNAEFLARYRFPVRRLLSRLLPARWQQGNSYLRDGYEAWEREVGHLHRFTSEEYARMARAAGLDVRTVYAIHGWWSMLAWECEMATFDRARLGYLVRILVRALVRPLTRAVERLHPRGHRLDLIGVLQKPARPSTP